MPSKIFAIDKQNVGIAIVVIVNESGAAPRSFEYPGLMVRIPEYDRRVKSRLFGDIGKVSVKREPGRLASRHGSNISGGNALSVETEDR